MSQTIQNFCQRIVGDSYSLLEVCIEQEQNDKTRVSSVEPATPATKVDNGNRAISNNEKSSIQKDSVQATTELIKNTQSQLNALGYKAGKADGVSGKKTKMAIEAFQKDKGLTVDGKHSYSLLSEIQMSKK